MFKTQIFPRHAAPAGCRSKQTRKQPKHLQHAVERQIIFFFCFAFGSLFFNKPITADEFPPGDMPSFPFCPPADQPPFSLAPFRPVPPSLPPFLVPCVHPSQASPKKPLPRRRQLRLVTDGSVELGQACIDLANLISRFCFWYTTYRRAGNGMG